MAFFFALAASAGLRAQLLLGCYASSLKCLRRVFGFYDNNNVSLLGPTLEIIHIKMDLVLMAKSPSYRLHSFFALLLDNRIFPMFQSDDLDVLLPDSSIIFQRRYADLLSRSSTDRTGRLLRYDPRAKRASVMYKGLMFPNGVALSQNRSFLLVAETIRKRILKFNLGDEGGLNNNEPKVFAELPRVPDNSKMNEKGEFWVALNTGRLGETSNDGPDPIGVKYDGEGSILQELDGNGGTIFNSISEVNEELCPLIKNILLLDSEGKRIAVKYYSDDWPTNSAKEAFEKAVFAKTQKTNARTDAEITMFDNYVVVYKFVQDLHFFVTGGENENEIILAAVLQGFFDAVGLLLRGTVDKKEALENLDLILLCLDEIVDGGIILETDANVIAGKVASHSMDAGAPLSEQTITQALATAREHLTRSLLK
ncbi:hypothetical protein PVK06_031009 [Gossypium arboreum]|uniref:Coatomer subunit zeta n=1 Tax=Gossypium arboreum TaxID=29729 RepID=A0ABR0NS65_GOSAR|nr:hypothetical protein PVK06_031009 [Gossypium arboreum]